jgi:HD-like signal output (HDOD) protein/AmiR/NasT family two-component response regulator
MSAVDSSPEVLIADADPWTADLLKQQVLSVRSDARVLCVQDGQSALARCKRCLPALVIADGELPDMDGLELLRQLRRHPRTPPLPFILISGRLDSTSVRAAKPLAPTAYLIKPLNVEALFTRLVSLLSRPDETPLPATQALLMNRLEDYLDAMREGGQGAPLLENVQQAVNQCMHSQAPLLHDLEESFAHDPQISACLITAANLVANSMTALDTDAQYSTPCQTLCQALPRLGVARALNLVLGLCIQRNARLKDPRLAEQAVRVWSAAQRSAEVAYWLANQLALDAELCYTAGLLHNIGELALLRCLQQWLDAGGSLSDEQIPLVLRQRSSGFGAALRTRWRLSFGLRELVAAFYGLNDDMFSREALVLNLVREIIRKEQQLPGELRDTPGVRLLQLDPNLLEHLPPRSSLS